MTEKEMIDKFIQAYENKNKNIFSIDREVPHKGGWIDLVIDKSNQKIAIEAKLSNIMAASYQALKSVFLYDATYVLFPFSKKDLILKKYKNWFERINVGVILFHNNRYYYLIKPRKEKPKPFFQFSF